MIVLKNVDGKKRLIDGRHLDTELEFPEGYFCKETLDHFEKIGIYKSDVSSKAKKEVAPSA